MAAVSPRRPCDPSVDDPRRPRVRCCALRHGSTLRAPGTRDQLHGDRPVRVVHVRLELDLDLAGQAPRGRGDADARGAARRARRRSSSTPSRWTSRGDGRRPRRRPSTTTARAARDLPRAVRARRRVRRRRPLPLRAAPRALLHGPRRGAPRPRAAVLDAGAGRRLALLLAVHRPAHREVHDRGVCTAPAGNFVLSNGDLRERDELPGAARVRWHYALDFPQPAYLVTLVCGPFVEIADARPQTGVDVYYFAAPGREADARPQLRAHARDDRPLLRADRRALPAHALQPDRRARLHLRRHGEHERDDADRARAGRRAGGARPRRRRPGVARARAPVVGRPRDLPRVVRGLAQRGLRDLLRVRVARARQGPRRGRLRAARRHRGVPGRGRALPAAGRVPPVRRADPPLRRAPVRQGRARAAHAAQRAGRRAVLARARHYARKHARGSVETRDLARAIEEVSGRSFDEFLDRWIARPGHPELECAWEWDDERSVGTLRVAQKQTVDAEAPLFEFDARCASRSTARSATSPSSVARRRTRSSSSCRRGRRRWSSIRATSS